MELSAYLRAWLGPIDPDQRRAMVGAWLQQQTSPQTQLLQQWLRQARQGDGAAQEALLSCCDPRWWFTQLGGEQGVANWRHAALEEQCELANLWLVACSPAQWHEQLVVEATLIHPTLRQMTLGARRSWARNARLEQLAAVAVDPDPIVLQHALQHPNMTESIVLLGCSRRPTTAAALWTFAANWRWFTRSEIRFALASNSFLPAGLGICLLFTLPNRILRQLQADGLLSPTLQRAAMTLLQYA